MRYLGLALFAEGATDHSFLAPLVRRLATDTCRRRAQQEVEIGPPIELHSPPALARKSREERILEAARNAAGGYHVLFVHTDGG